MADVVKKTTKTLTLKNPSSSSLTKIIKDKLDIDVNNLKGSDIPKLFKKGLKFKGLLGKKVVDSIGNYFKKNPNTKKQYEKFLPDTLKKGIKKDKKVTTPSVKITPKKIKKIDISNIMKNPRTGRGQNLPTRTTDKNKKTGSNITKRVIEGEVLQGVKPPQGGSKPQSKIIDGKFRNITDKPKRIGGSQNKINTQGLKRRQFLSVDKDFPKIKPKKAESNIIKKDKPPKDKFTPKIKKPDSPKVEKKELPKIKTPIKKKRSNIVTSSGKPSSTYDAQFTYDNLKKRGLNPKNFMSPENFKKVKNLSAGDKVGLKDLPPKSINPGIHKLPAKAKMNMGFKPMFGGGLIASFYDKPAKTEKYKGNTTSARQVKGYGKAKRP